jgi:hypothetical protein
MDTNEHELCALQRRCSAGFQTCCIADFQIGRPGALCGFRNPRHSRLGSVRYFDSPHRAELSDNEAAAPFVSIGVHLWFKTFVKLHHA